MMSRVFSLLTHDNKIHKPILKDNLEGHVTYANSLVSQSVKFTNCNKNAHLISSLLNIVVKRMIDHELQLYDEQQAGQKKGGLESLSHEELVAKCKNLLNIAQKAKKAKDEALEELSNQEAKFKEELKSIRDKASADTSHSIQMKKNLLDLQLEYDTCQKKMSSLEEEHKVCNARIKKIENQLSIEYDKRKNAELLNNNLNEDLNKLTESSGQMRLICKRVMEEKEEIEKDFKEIFQQKIEWTRYLQTAFPNESITSVEDWIAILTNSSQSKSFGDLEEENRSLKGGNEELKNKVEKLERVIEDLIKKKDGVSSEIVSLKNDKEKMMEELSEVRNSRDALLKKLDEVRIETTQLIENSEKLSEENGVLRFEKEKFESSFNSLSTEHLKSINEIVDLKATNDELVGRLESTRRKLEEGESGLNKMKSEKIVVDSRVVELENCVRSLEEKLEENCRENSEKLALSIENADIKRQLETMMEENADLARKIQLQDMDKEKAVIAVKDECIKYEKDLEKLSFDIRAKDEIIHELQAQSEGFKKVEENLSQKFEEHNKEKDEIVDNLKAHCKTLENELEKLRKDINEQVLNKDKVVELQLECDSLQKVEHNLRQKIEDQKQEKERIVNELKGNCKVFEDKIDVLKQELKNKDEVVKSLETKCFEFENEMKLLKQRIDEQNQNKEKIVKELQSECSSIKKSEKLLEQKIEELKKREEMYKKQFLEYDKLRDEIDELKQEKEIQLENHRKTLENHKSRESWNIERIQQQLKNHYESELVMHVEKSEKLSDKLKKYVNKLEVLQKENREVNNRLIVIEEEKNKIEKMLENNLKIKENSCEIEMMNSDSNKKSSDIENVLQKRSKLISDTNRVCLNFFKMVLSSVDSRTGSGLEDIRKYIDEATSENFEVDIVELDNLFKTVCKVVIGKGEVQSELEKRLEVIGNEKEVLKKEKEVLESEKGELESREKELLDKICGLEKDFEATKLGVNQKEDEQRKKLEEDEKMRSSLKECKEKLRMSLEDKKKTEEIIDDLKCETGKLNSLLIVVQQERDSASSLLHKCQLEKRDLESQVEKLRLEDEENLHKLQDLNDRYLSMEEKLNFIFNENEELKGVLELEEVHDNLLKEIENMIGNNVEVLSDTVSNEFRNKSIKFDSSILLKYLNEIISSLNETIKEKNNKLNGLDEEVELVKKQLENILSESEEVKMLVRVLNERVSGFETESIELRVKILGQIIENSKFFEGLCDSYAKVTGADLVEARKSLEVKLVELNENGWKTDGKTEGKESEKQMADDFKAKEEEIVQLQEKNKELKGVAVKMKKKINDLNQLLDAEKQKVDAERTKLSQLSAVAKNAQMLQQECDRLADELEECKKTIKQLQKVNDSLESEHKDLQQKYNEKENRFANVEKEIAALKTQLESAVSKESSLVKELEEVKTEKHVEEVIRKECDKELIITQDKLRKVQLDLDQALLESQKHTVLTQEKHDYEQQLSQSHQNMSQLECKLKEQGTSLAQLTTQLEAERRDKDELAIQLTKLTADSQKAIDSARTQIDALLNRVSQLEQDLRTVTVERQRFEEEAERLEREFGAYKVRAQSVLRQKEHGGGSAEQEFRDKCAQLQEHCDRTKAQLDSTVEELEQVKLKLGSVLAEKEALDKKCENINNILVQRNKELDRRMMEHRQHKLSTDTLIQCYKTQLEEKERGHQIELDALRMQLTKLSSRVNSSDTDLGGSDAVKEVGDVENANFYHQTEHHLSISTHASNTRHSPIDSAGEHGKTLPPRPPLIEREDGEGSEGNEVSMFPGSLSNKTGLVPLAKLLSSSLGSDEERDVLSLEKFESLQNEMLASNTRVKHLAALLSEAEKDSALMEEQNTVLKEEIRRLQRCIERQPHAHNVEYLKNVVFKFATLASGDEKSRLVPVLDTILKLSPEEHKQLAAVAKGETEQTSGWSSYLPTWQ